MKWRRGGKSPDVIDQRGSGGGGGGGGFGRGGGGFPIPMGKGGGALGIIAVIVFILIQVIGGGGSGGGFGIPGGFPTNAQAPGTDQAEPIPPGQDPQKEIKDFSAYVFTDVQDFWTQTFQQQGQTYNNAKLILYSGGVDTGCGSATSAVGPFYCPADQRTYFDLTFYDQLSNELQAPGDFAWAYVIAHEMGHHIQTQLGTSDQVTSEQSSNPDDANELSVRLELQADCYAGVWGKTVFEEGALEAGDLEEAFVATEAIGDDRLQQQAGQEIDTDSFTHGSSEQRNKWWRTGYDSGDPAACDTFSPDEV